MAGYENRTGATDMLFRADLSRAARCAKRMRGAVAYITTVNNRPSS